MPNGYLKSPFNYFGGKFYLLDLILPFLEGKSQRYVEVFGGSAVCLLNKEKRKEEVLNDLNKEVVNFWHVVKTAPQKLQVALQYTPYHREEYFMSQSPNLEDSELERARKFYTSIRLGFSGMRGEKKDYTISMFLSRQGMSASCSRFLGGIARIPTIAERMKDVKIECLDFETLIPKYDSEDTVFYCDPPYPVETVQNDTYYELMMTTEDHERMGKLLNESKGKIVLSGHACHLYDKQLFSDWYPIEATEHPTLSQHANPKEKLWLNFDPDEINSGLFA